jgi:uncharacterized protein (DUF1499 family)
VTLGLAGLGLLLLAVAGPLYRIGLPLPAAVSVLRWGAYTGLCAAALALVAGVLAYRGGRRAAAALAVVALVAGLTAAGIPYSWQRRAAAAPPIHDISTDLENPPQFEAIVPLRAEAPNTLERPPELAGLQREGYPDLAPITLAVPPDQAFDRALAAAQEAGWEIVTADKAAGRIEATDTTRWFGFKEDVVVRLTPWGAGTRVDMRSASRAGQSDIGSNAERIEAFLGRLQG